MARQECLRLLSPADFELREGEQLAIVGPNASGKSLLADMLTGKSPLKSGSLSYGPGVSLRYISFRDSYGTADANYYYQQRWNMGDQEELPTVRESLGFCADEPLRRELLELFGFESQLDKPVMYLSSGEMRRFQLIRMLQARPRVLMMDNPYIGLDADTRRSLTELLERLVRERRLSLILVVSRNRDIPDLVTHVYPMNGRVLGTRLSRKDWLSLPEPEDGKLPDEMAESLRRRPFSPLFSPGDEIIGMDGVNLVYGSRTILKDLVWQVRCGEKWSLAGRNGAGKSALLSLVCADNPQGYACRFRMFGRRRGSGESIWEIKKHIGYVSPEMHRAYMKDCPAVDIVASGLHDSIGLYVRPQPGQREICLYWMGLFGITGLADRPFLQLSSGEQRLCLLARAFVKDPSLLILDEPLHGLDAFYRQRVRSVVQTFAQRPGKTLVMATHYPEELPECIGPELFLQRRQ